MKQFYSQKDIRWANKNVGTSKEVFKKIGCFVVTLANMTGKTPLEVNDLLVKNYGFYGGNLVIPGIAARLLGLRYHGLTQNEPDYLCVAETNRYAPEYPQHFFLWRPGNYIVNPLDVEPAWKPNPYNIISYRLFSVGESGRGTDNSEMTNTQFLHSLYMGFFNHTPDIDGLNFWLDKIEKEKVPHSEIIRGFLSSDEAQKHFKYVI